MRVGTGIGLSGGFAEGVEVCLPAEGPCGHETAKLGLCTLRVKRHAGFGDERVEKD